MRQDDDDADMPVGLDDLELTLARLEAKCAAASSSPLHGTSLRDLQTEYAEAAATVLLSAADHFAEANDDDHDAWLQLAESHLESLASSCSAPEAWDASQPEFADAIARSFFDLARLCDDVGLVVPVFATTEKGEAVSNGGGGIQKAAAVRRDRQRYEDTSGESSSDSDDDVAWCADIVPHKKPPSALKSLFTDMAMPTR